MSSSVGAGREKRAASLSRSRNLRRMNATKRMTPPDQQTAAGDGYSDRRLRVANNNQQGQAKTDGFQK